jgi:hypothetical protein
VAIESVLQAQVQSLIGHVRKQQSVELGGVLRDAEKIAAEIIQQAHGRSREAVRRAIAQRRRILRETTQRDAAAAATRKRRQQQQQARAALDSTWPQLEDALRERWLSASTREAWWRETVNQATRLLLTGQWSIEHPADWPENERQQALTQLASHGHRQCETRSNPELAAGLRISSENACVDSSIEGLLADRL